MQEKSSTKASEIILKGPLSDETSYLGHHQNVWQKKLIPKKQLLLSYRTREMKTPLCGKVFV